MKTLITGASGMLGNATYREARLRGDEVQGWAGTTPKTPDRLKFQVRNLASAQWLDLMVDYQPEVVIHCAAMTDAEYCEEHKTQAWTMNAWLPGALAGVARQNGVKRFIHVSTDAVYDDTKAGRRHETDQPNPLSVYASTKLEGEGRVLAADPNALVVRTTMFGWTLPKKRPKLAEQVLAALTDRREIPLWTDAWFSPLHVAMLGEILLDLADTDATGILNVGCKQPICKADFGRAIAEVFGLDGSFIRDTLVDDVPLKARRTKNVGLNVHAVEKVLGPMPTVDDGIRELYREAHDGQAKRVRGRTTYP